MIATVAGCRQLGLEDAEPVKDPPQLSFSETTYDFGRVAQGTVVEHVFPFTNTGGSDLTMTNLRTACDCHAALVGERDVAPHAAGAVRARIETDEMDGPQRRTVTVYSNDPLRQAVTLTLTGDVALDVVADPPRVYLGIVPPGAPALREVAIRTATDGLRIGPARVGAPQLAVQLADVPADPYRATLTVGTARDAPLGPFTAAIRIPTTSRAHPLLRVEVAGILAADAPTPRPPDAGTPTPAPTADDDDAEDP